MSSFLDRLFRPLAPETRPSRTLRERNFASHFEKQISVRYSGREDMCGLRVVGRRMGFEICRNETTGRLYVQSIDVYNGFARKGRTTLHLKGRDTLESLLPKIKGWVA